MTSFDFIIVGAGTAGCVLAARLSADPNRRVLLLEAGGGDRHPHIRIPAAFSKLFKTKRDWAYSTEPERELDGRRLYIPRGRMLGGSSSMNAMIYIRGNRADYDGWSESGCPGWSYDEILPLFLESENQEWGASAFHGAGGPLDVADLRSPNPLTLAFLDAAVEKGYSRNSDFNGASQEGVGLYQVTQRNGARWSAARAWLAPSMRRANLRVQTGALSTRVLCSAGRAIGVEYQRNGRIQRVMADSEVILSGGAINSPHLLLLSGIGAADDVRSAGLEVTSDLPGVGRNLQDHPVAGMMWSSTQPVSLASAESIANAARFLFLRRGPLTSNVAEAGGFLRLTDELDAPNLQFHFAPVYFQEHGFVRPEGHGYSLGATLISSRSRGRVRLRTGDPSDHPIIEGNYFHDGRDMSDILEGLRRVREIGEADAFARYRGHEVLPGSDARSTSELEEHVRKTAEMIYHPVGTCRMGADEMSVVDPQLRVRGVEGLRVVDASIMPVIVRGNTNAATVMIAEKGAKMILSG